MFKTPFKSSGHYVFDYKPRYYNERKERIEALEDNYKAKSQNKEQSDNEYQVTLSKNHLRNSWSKERSSSSADRKSNYRLALIIAILTGIVFYILK